MMLFKFTLFFILFSSASFSQEIKITAPQKDQTLVEGVINFQWKRPNGDKSRVFLEVRLKESQVVVLERMTIGTRRTKWLSPGRYEIRLSRNSLVKETDWREFEVVSRTGKKSVVSRPPVKKAPVKKAQPVEKENEAEDLSYFEEMLLVKKDLVKKAKKPETLEVLKWFAPEKGEDGAVRVRVQFRAKNNFGELKDQDFLYFLKSQKIIHIQNLKAIN